MVVAGKVHVSGTMRSQGAVHIYAVESGLDTGKINIDNASDKTLLATDTIIFYSNDKFDGLLRNLNESGGGVVGLTAGTSPKQVILRKKFADNAWTYFSLPFKADKGLKRGNGTTIPGSVYDLFEFNPEGRAVAGKPDTAVVWKRVGSPTGTIVTLDYAKANGYQIKFDAGQGGEIDFISNDPNDIDTLFSNNKAKPVRYNTYGTTDLWDDQNSDNWAFIGGLFSATYTMDHLTTDYKGTIYYREVESSQASPTPFTFGQVYIPDRPKIIGPFTPFYVQGEYGAGDTLQTFTFKEGVRGLLLDHHQFRSSNDNLTKDLLYFALSSDKNGSDDCFYLNFADNYVESYQSIEDAIKMSTAYGSRPAVYSLQDGTNRELFVNGLPMKDGREVKMGFSVPEAGDYTISLDAKLKQDVRSVILQDKVTGKKIDLLQTPYSFNTSALKGETGRFALFINSSYTDIPSIEADAPYAFAKDNLLTVRNLGEGDKVQIFDLSGRLIASGKASGKEFSAALSQKGVYVVNVKGGKTSVLKVLNK
ncbi:hypothetical protein AGMMS50239_13580 [Bacteroidia bacterium]|nr:hypothetical protein AGMMS50239_13580 [Bacteroidia bacterium]GHV30703.1 hypothetical protein FACS1894177_03750 [Bacteroidia bacterium]